MAGIEKAARSLDLPDNYVLVYIEDGAKRFAYALSEFLGVETVSSIKIKSYVGTTSQKFEWIKEPDPAVVKDKPVLLVDDIFDTGRTIVEAKRKLIEAGAAYIHTCVLLMKDKPRSYSEGVIDCAVFHVPDEFVVGFGLDYDGEYRDLNGIYILNYNMQ